MPRRLAGIAVTAGLLGAPCSQGAAPPPMGAANLTINLDTGNVARLSLEGTFQLGVVRSVLIN